jgi:PAS domain S-box-containing protein
MKLSSRLTFAMVGLVVATALAIGWVTNRNLERVALPRALERIETHARLLAAELSTYVRGARADIAGFRSAVALNGIVRARLGGGIDPLDGMPEKAWRQRMAERYAAELASKPAYSRFRIIGIDDGGREIVRVDRSGKDGAIRIVPDAELPKKGDRDYFTAAIRLPPDEIYISPVELNRANGTIETPHVPVLRVAAPIQAPDGKPFGIVIINVDMRPIFTEIRAATRPGTEFYVVNEQGDYLVNPQSARELAFEFGRANRWQNDFPQFAAAFGAGETAARALLDADNERVGVGMAWTRLAGGPKVAVVEIVPDALLMASAGVVRHSSVLAALAAILVATVLAVIIARSLARPLVQMTAAVEGFAHGRPITVPTEAGGEIGVLARAFGRMTAEVQEKTAALQREIELHRRTEVALERHANREQLFNAAVESSNDAIVTMTLDGIITGWNPACERLFEFEARAAIGRSVDIIVPSNRQTEVRDVLGKVRRGEKVESFETTRFGTDRKPIDISISISPVKSPSGTIVGACTIARDVTERNKAQQALLESEQMARGIIDTALDAFVQMDETGKIIDWNLQAEAIFGWSHDEAVGQVLGDLIVPKRLRALHEKDLARFLRGGESTILGKRFEIEAQRRDGREIKIEVSVTALLRRSGYLFNGFMRDLTEKIAAEAQFRQAQKMDAVGQLTGGIAHDFNNMLTVITGTIEILAEAVADRPQLAAVAKMIDDAAERGADLTQHLLAFARKQPLQPQATDINALIVEAAKLLRSTLGEHVEIESMLDSDSWPALVDPNQLATALVNLALNARDAMPAGGKLMLETGNVYLDEGYTSVNREVPAGPYVMIAVSDTGGGIPAAIRDKVFEPFFTTKGIGKGTGLGLSMVYGFVKQSGGHIKIYSEEGHGTTIKIYLPRASGLLLQQSADVPLAPSGGGHESVLVVEDDAMVRDYVVAQLRSLGYSTLIAKNSAEALSVIDSAVQLDLLFTDVIMPGAMNGRQLADEATRRRPSLKVLFTSGYPENAIVHHGRLDPGVLLLAKPYRKSDLARMVRTAFDAMSVAAA